MNETVILQAFPSLRQRLLMFYENYSVRKFFLRNFCLL